MESRYLECFVHVVEQGSIAEAARTLDLAPATAAQRLKALESSMQCQLLQRAGRTVKPTVAGSRVLGHARAILAAERDMRAAATNTDLPPGPLRLGATPTALAGILPDALKRWVRRYPAIPVFIDPAVTPLLHARLLEGELDVAVLAHPNYALPKTCSWQTLSREELVMLAPRALAVQDVPATLGREPFIQYDRRTVAGRMVDDYLKRRRIQPPVRFEVDGIAPIVDLVRAGLGISVLPNSPIIGSSEPALRRWPLPPPSPHRTMGALWLRSSPRARLAEVFVEMALKVHKR